MTMGIMDLINKHKKDRENKRYAAMLSGYSPVYSQFGQNIYASDVVQQAISCIVMELKKLTPKHIRYMNTDYIPINDGLDRLLRRPNERMTTSDFLEKTF